MLCFSGGSVSATEISVNGNVFGFCSFDPAPQTHVAPPMPADPLAYLPKPAVPACGTSVASPYHGSNTAINVVAAVPATFYPYKAYCGGIVINAGATAAFMPGTYVLTSTNSLGQSSGSVGIRIDLGSTITGDGVTFYNYGPSGAISLQDSSLPAGGVRLFAPTSGTYAAVLFFQDPQNTSTAQIHGLDALNTALEGIYYFPTAKVTYENSGSVHYNSLIAYDIEFQSGTIGSLSTFTNSYATIKDGSSNLGNGAVLIQ